jgi:hypothetical protein
LKRKIFPRAKKIRGKRKERVEVNNAQNRKVKYAEVKCAEEKKERGKII